MEETLYQSLVFSKMFHFKHSNLSASIADAFINYHSKLFSDIYKKLYKTTNIVHNISHCFSISNTYSTPPKEFTSAFIPPIITVNLLQTVNLNILPVFYDTPKYDEPMGTLYFDCDFCIDNFPMTYKDYLKQYEIVKLKLL